MALLLEDISRRYGGVTAVAGVSFTVSDSEILALLGPSGSGKSTLLRLIAGLEPADAGRISLDGRDLAGVPAQRRNFGVVFQDFALFPHLDVKGNIVFGLQERRWPREQQRQRLAELLELTGLHGLADRRISQLSGGQQQRVALARALAPQPALLLLDEPLSNLDANLRESLTGQLAGLLARSGLSAVHVTHDRAEAFRLAHSVGILREGRLVQHGPVAQVFAAPRNPWVARFLGWRNVYSQAPAGAGSSPVLLDDGQVSLAVEGSGVDARVLEVQSSGSGLELRLQPRGWPAELHWTGHRRELPQPPRAGDSLGLDIPASAWVPLQADEA